MKQIANELLGWLCNACWQASLAAAAYLAATLMQSLILLNNPNYGYQRWHGSLLTIALLSVAIIFNTFLAKRLPLVEGILVVCHILGIVILIPLWIYSPTRIGGSPLLEFNNPNGWMSVGVATLVGVNSPVGALIGLVSSGQASFQTTNVEESEAALGSSHRAFDKQEPGALDTCNNPQNLYTDIYTVLIVASICPRRPRILQRPFHILY